MNRIDSIFAELRSSGRRALMPFITAGYPTLETTGAILPALQEAGASICEIGIPFSDPIADGPVIQASMTHALNNKIQLEGIFETVAGLRSGLSIGLIAMVSYSIVNRVGAEAFIDRAKRAGFDGFIFPDLPLEEAPETARLVKGAGLSFSLLIAPTTPDDRAAEIARLCSGFVYVLARSGITGERADLPVDLIDRLAKLRKITDLPIAVGFGISSAEHVRSVTAADAADAAIVGSALVKHITKHIDESPGEIAGAVKAFAAELAGGLERG